MIDGEAPTTKPIVANNDGPAANATVSEPENAPDRWARIRETLTLILLSVTAVLTAWCGFQSSKWGGEMSIAFSQAAAARIEAARQQNIAQDARLGDLTTYGVYIQAEAEGNEQLARYVESRFDDEFRVAFDAWVAAGRPTKAPFGMPQYVPPGTTEAQAAEQRADQLFSRGLINNRRGDNYALLAVLAALVLFFGAISGRLSRPPLQLAALIFAGVLFLFGASVAATLPVIV
jgi:hypothetical protein